MRLKKVECTKFNINILIISLSLFIECFKFVISFKAKHSKLFRLYRYIRHNVSGAEEVSATLSKHTFIKSEMASLYIQTTGRYLGQYNYNDHQKKCTHVINLFFSLRESVYPQNT